MGTAERGPPRRKDAFFRRYGFERLSGWVRERVGYEAPSGALASFPGALQRGLARRTYLGRRSGVLPSSAVPLALTSRASKNSLVAPSCQDRRPTPGRAVA